MPNWCFTNITTEKKVIDYMKSKDIEFDFNNILPMPKDLESTTKPSDKTDKQLIAKYGYDNWYDWSVSNWGTKWNACQAERADDECISFKTAWSPPEQIFYALSKKFPDNEINIICEEEGQSFYFFCTYLNGVVIKEDDLTFWEDTDCPVCDEGYIHKIDDDLLNTDPDLQWAEYECDECSSIIRKTRLLEFIIKEDDD